MSSSNNLINFKEFGYNSNLGLKVKLERRKRESNL